MGQTTERLRNDNTRQPNAMNKREVPTDLPITSSLLYNQGDPLHCVAVVLSFRNPL